MRVIMNSKRLGSNYTNKQLLILFVVSFVATLFLFTLNPIKVNAISGYDFNAGQIIDDAVFFNNRSMNTSQIQQFLDSKVPSCDTNGTQPYKGTTRAAYGASRGYPAPYTCLKNYSESIQTRPGDTYCGGTVTGGNKSSAQIIYDVSQACIVNPQVLIDLLQKEQSLVTDDWPWSIQYRSATGYGCPDTAPCDSEYYGFFNQVYQAARAYNRYKINYSNYNYRAGRDNTILWNPNSGCGTSNVFIANQATAGLYIYTPYRPNQAALDNLYGTGDGCSSYGNRNFWRIFNDWFGSTRSNKLDLRNSLKSNSLNPNTTMQPGDFITSPNGRFVLTMQSDGNLVIYSGRRAMWSSNTYGNYGAYAKFQNDGNFVIYSLSDQALWSTATYGLGANILTLKDNGNFYVLANTEQKYSTNIKVNQYAQIFLGSVINSNTTMPPNSYLQSPDGVYSLIMQGDGNLVLYAPGDATPLWASNTYGNVGAYAVMQNDGNLVVYSSGNVALWSSKTYGNGLSMLRLQDDGNLAIFKLNTSILYWHTATYWQF